MRRIPAIVAAGALLSATSGQALTFFNLTTGDEALLPDARSAAMGGTRGAEAMGAFTGASNPAFLPRLSSTEAALFGSVLKLKETRSTPAYDSFDAFLVESIYALNDEYQTEGGGGAATSFELLGLPLGAGFSYAPVRDFQYAYSEEVRDNNAFTQPRDQLIAVNEVQSDGMLNAWSLAAGATPIDAVDVGVSLQLLQGKHDLLARTRYVQEDRVEFARVNASELDGTRWIVGAAVRPHHSVTAAAIWRSDTDLSGKYLREGDPASLGFSGATGGPTEPTGSVVITYPQELTFGVAWHPRAKLLTTVRFDADWAEWSKYQNALYAGPDLSDVWGVRLGIEHVFYNGFPMRFGIRYTPAPLDEEVATTAFTFGSGLDVGPLRADLAFEIANRHYRFDDLFDDALFGGNSHVTKDFVEENGAALFVTVGTKFAPFGG